jgi:hypothetical protein
MVLLASNYDQSKFLRAQDLTEAKRFKIKSVTEEKVGIGADQDPKLVVWFTNSAKGLVLNKTNNRALRGAFGDDTAGWPGKIIEIFPTEADFRGRMVPALRVRIPPPAQEKPAVTTKPAPPVVPGPEDELDDEIPF